MKRIMAMLMLFAFGANAEVPSLMNYQGRLVGTNGIPVNANVSITVNLYTNSSGGTPVYTEAVGAVPVVNGLYSFNFFNNGGASLPSIANTNTWMETVVDGVAMSPRSRLASVPYASCVNENTLSETTENLTGMILELQSKLAVLQAGGTPSSTSDYYISDVFSVSNGANNLVNSQLTTSYYSSPFYTASRVVGDSTEYNTPAYVFWVKLANYSNINAQVRYLQSEIQLDTISYFVLTFADSTTFQTTTKSGSGDMSWLTVSFTNAQLSKIVTNIEVWAEKPGSLANNNAHVRNIKIFKYQPVDIAINLASYANPIKECMLTVDATRQTNDSITYGIENAGSTNINMLLNQKVTLPVAITNPATLKITLTPPPIDTYSIDGTKLRSCTLRLW